MLSWRITKYNPQSRDSKGVCLVKDEWTSYSDIGKSYAGYEFTFEQYMQTENAYVEAIFTFMDCLHLNELRIANLERHDIPTESKFYSQAMLDLFELLKNGMCLSRDSINNQVRLVLRENVWCRLEGNGMFVHFGYDYYMYIGSEKLYSDSIAHIERAGLFVESYESPYLSQES